MKLTERPTEMREGDVEQLRSCGYDDYEIHDAIQVVSYFNYINRIADAVHVDLEPEMAPYPEEQPADSDAGSAAARAGERRPGTSER